MTRPSVARNEARQTDSEPQFLRLNSVERITGLTRSTIFRLIALHQFPAPVRLGLRAIAWRKADLDHWSDSRQPVVQ